MRFPPENYPTEALLIELKSQTLHQKVLENFEKTFEAYAKQNLIGKPQIIQLVKYAAKTLEENPLCVCYEEVIRLRQSQSAEIRLKQKKASLKFRANGGKYSFGLTIQVPEDYPNSRPTWDSYDTNFPSVIYRFLDGQAREIVRRCIEPPLRTTPNAFKITPSLFRALNFVTQAVHDFNQECCPVCNCPCLPEDPKNVELKDTEELYVERAYCGHLYHAKCLKKYFSEPPFPEGGKLCAATSKHARPDGPGKAPRSSDGCGQRLLHDKWALDPKKAEQRWAHKKARDRELEEIVDFLK